MAHAAWVRDDRLWLLGTLWDCGITEGYTGRRQRRQRQHAAAARPAARAVVLTDLGPAEWVCTEWVCGAPAHCHANVMQMVRRHRPRTCVSLASRDQVVMSKHEGVNEGEEGLESLIQRPTLTDQLLTN